MTIQIEELLKLPAKEREYIVGELYESLLHEEYDEDQKLLKCLISVLQIWKVGRLRY